MALRLVVASATPGSAPTARLHPSDLTSIDGQTGDVVVVSGIPEEGESTQALLRAWPDIKAKKGGDSPAPSLHAPFPHALPSSPRFERGGKRIHPAERKIVTLSHICPHLSLSKNSHAEIILPAIARRSANAGAGDSVSLEIVVASSVIEAKRVNAVFLDEAVLGLGLEVNPNPLNL